MTRATRRARCDTADDFCARVVADPQLATSFAADLSAGCRGLRASARTLLADGDSGLGEVGRFVRGAGLTPHEYDLMAHHLVASVLLRRLGPDLLVRVGGRLADLRARLIGPPD